MIGNIDTTVEYDVVFAYHFPTIDYLLKRGLRCRKMVLGSLSPIELLESFSVFCNNASLLVVMSETTKDIHNLNYDISMEKMVVLENCIPDKFVDYQVDRVLSEMVPKKIAVVSNHIPQEVWDMRDYLPNDVEVTYFGSGTEGYQEITPQLLAEYDVVVTIGKTVQYSMGLGIPVFEYDRFGGNGYIHAQNMEFEAITNFTGRNVMRKLSAKELAEEIVVEYPRIKKQTYILRKLAIEKFLLSKRIDNLMNVIANSPDFDYDFSKIEYNEKLDFAHGEAFCNWTGALKSENYNLKHLLSETEKQKLLLENNIKELNALVFAIQNTEGYRLLEFLRRVKRKLKF